VASQMSCPNFARGALSNRWLLEEIRQERFEELQVFLVNAAVFEICEQGRWVSSPQLVETW